MLKFSTYIDLPRHFQTGGFGHADVHPVSSRLYMAHTCNDRLDVINTASERYSHSIPNLFSVTGVLISKNRVFCSNRGENTVGIFRAGAESAMVKVTVGLHPHGLAFDTGHNLLLVANAGDPYISDSYSISMLDAAQGQVLHTIPLLGRPRWAVFDRKSDSFYVTVADPAQILVISAKNPAEVAHVFSIPIAAPHGLELDIANHRLFCACDNGRLLTISLPDGKIETESELSGSPDVIFFHPRLNHLYAAIGDPGVIDVFDTTTMQRVETVQTEKEAHTLALDKENNRIYAFLPKTNRASVFIDS